MPDGEPIDCVLVDRRKDRPNGPRDGRIRGSDVDKAVAKAEKVTKRELDRASVDKVNVTAAEMP